MDGIHISFFSCCVVEKERDPLLRAPLRLSGLELGVVAHLDPFDLNIPEVSIFEARTAEIGTPQVSVAEIRVVEIRTTETSFGEIRSAKIYPLEQSVAEVDTAEVDTAEVGIKENSTPTTTAGQPQSVVG